MLQPEHDTVVDTPDAALVDFFAEWFRIPPDVLMRMLGSLLIILLIVLARTLLLRVVRRNIEDVKRHYRWRRTVNYGAGFLAVLLIGRIWLPGLEQVGVFLGLASAGLAIALRDPLICLVGWLFILVRRPYITGDRIEINGQIGDVIDVRMFQTYMLEVGGWLHGEQATGRIIMVPNAAVFSSPVANYTQGFDFIWDEMVVRLTFESDWGRAKALLTQIAESQCSTMCETARQQITQAAGKHMIFFQALTPTVYTSVQEWGVQLTVRYLTPPRQRRGTAQGLWEAILDAFAREENIRFAYPTTRFYTSGPTSHEAADARG